MLGFFFLGLWLVFTRPVLSDADFLSVRTSLDKDHSGKGGDKGVKYFHEATFHYHYDGRFASKTVDDSQRLPHLIALVKSYLVTMSDIGAETWLVHGTLLGWWWNQKIMPWDSDIDVQVTDKTMHFLAKYYNMTEYTFKLPNSRLSRTFLLEINPRHVILKNDWQNMIDARWIDTSSGLFIDITSVRKDEDARKEGRKGALMCKDSHRFNEEDIFPLRNSFFEGQAAKIPYHYTKLLETEYGKESLTNTVYKDHIFNRETGQWEKIQKKE